MKEEMINKMIEWVESSGSFIKGELPDYIDQFLKCELIKLWVGVSLLCVVLIILISTGIFCIVKYNTYEKSFDAPSFIVMGIMFSFAVSFVLIGILQQSVNDLITIHIAPKVYILNHLKNLLN